MFISFLPIVRTTRIAKKEKLALFTFRKSGGDFTPSSLANLIFQIQRQTHGWFRQTRRRVYRVRFRAVHLYIRVQSNNIFTKIFARFGRPRKIAVARRRLLRGIDSKRQWHNYDGIGSSKREGEWRLWRTILTVLGRTKTLSTKILFDLFTMTLTKGGTSRGRGKTETRHGRWKMKTNEWTAI